MQTLIQSHREGDSVKKHTHAHQKGQAREQVFIFSPLFATFVLALGLCARLGVTKRKEGGKKMKILSFPAKQIHLCLSLFRYTLIFNGCRGKLSLLFGLLGQAANSPRAESQGWTLCCSKPITVYRTSSFFKQRIHHLSSLLPRPLTLPTSLHELRARHWIKTAAHLC